MEITLEDGTYLNLVVTLSDGRKFTYKDIFQTYLKSGLKEEHMIEALSKIMSSNIEIEESILIKLKNKENSQKRYKEVEFSIDGVDSNSDDFYILLNSTGKCVLLK